MFDNHDIDRPGHATRIQNATQTRTNTTQPEVEELQAQMKRDVMNALEPSSQRQYSAHWDRYCAFYKNFLKMTDPLDASHQQISLYVTHLHNEGMKAPTIRSHLSSLTFYFNMSGESTPCDSFYTQKLLKSYAKTDKPISTREPITLQILTSMMQKIPDISKTLHETRMLQSLLTFMYHALTRISEVTKSTKNTHNLKPSQVVISQKELIIKFNSYKFSKGTTTQMAIQQQPDWCPLKLYKMYNSISSPSRQAAFTHKDNKPLTPAYIRRTSKALLDAINLNSHDYNTHSFRIGKATDMYKAGYTDSQIRMAGRWTTTAYKKYIKPQIVRF